MTAPAVKSTSGNDHVANLKVLPRQPAASRPSISSAPAFSPPPSAGMPPAPAPASPAETGNASTGLANESGQRYTLRGGGEAGDDGASAAKPKIQPRGLFVDRNGQIVPAPGAAPQAVAPDAMAPPSASARDSATSAQLYAADSDHAEMERNAGLAGGPTQGGRPSAMMKSTARGVNSASKTVVGNGNAARSSATVEAITGSQRMRQTNTMPSLSALPVERMAEVEVSLSPSQDAAAAETHVTLPPGLRFATASTGRTQTIWRGAVKQKKSLRLSFKIVGVQTGVWPVDIALQKPDGTKLDSLTVKVTVVP
jgi:hypothetical protein